MDKVKEIIYEKRLKILLDHFSIDQEYLNSYPNLYLYQTLPLKLLLPYIDDDKFKLLSSNPTLTIDFIEKNIDKNWNWRMLTFNKDVITEEFIDKYIDKDWDWYYISYNASLSFIDRHNDKINWIALSKNSNLTCEYIENNLYKNWDWIYLSSSKIINGEFVKKYLNKTWNWSELTRNSNITLEFIEANKELPWDWIFLSNNKNITIEYIEANPHINWQWPMLSMSLKIDQKIIDKYEDKINWYYLSSNDSLTLEILEKYIDKDWDWFHLNTRKLLTLEFIEKYIDNVKYCLIYNEIIPLEFVIKFIDKKWKDKISSQHPHSGWCWEYISKYFNITFSDFMKYKDIGLQWTIDLFYNINIFNIDIHDEDYIKEVNKYMALQKIKRITREVTCNPVYKLARKKIKEMFEEII